MKVRCILALYGYGTAMVRCRRSVDVRLKTKNNICSVIYASIEVKFGTDVALKEYMKVRCNLALYGYGTAMVRCRRSVDVRLKTKNNICSVIYASIEVKFGTDVALKEYMKVRCNLALYGYGTAMVRCRRSVDVRLKTKNNICSVIYASIEVKFGTEVALKEYMKIRCNLALYGYGTAMVRCRRSVDVRLKTKKNICSVIYASIEVKFGTDVALKEYMNVRCNLALCGYDTAMVRCRRSVDVRLKTKKNICSVIYASIEVKFGTDVALKEYMKVRCNLALYGYGTAMVRCRRSVDVRLKTKKNICSVIYASIEVKFGTDVAVEEYMKVCCILALYGYGTAMVRCRRSVDVRLKTKKNIFSVIYASIEVKFGTDVALEEYMKVRCILALYGYSTAMVRCRRSVDVGLKTKKNICSVIYASIEVKFGTDVVLKEYMKVRCILALYGYSTAMV